MYKSSVLFIQYVDLREAEIARKELSLLLMGNLAQRFPRVRVPRL